MIAYIGPGPGLAIQAPLLIVLLALVAAGLSLLSFPFRYLRRRGWRRRPGRTRRVVVIGLDGLEPTRVERLLAEGRLPHLQALGQQGCYRRLGTTLPPLSPVAWSSFSTGVNPGKHGIFGFVERDQDYHLRLTSASVQTVRARLGPLPLPWKVEKPVFRRKSTSFWKLLVEAGVPTHVLRVPITWPPENFPGFLLSAMGAPDLLGTQGTYTLFSVDRPPTLRHGQHGRLEVEEGGLAGEICGPGQCRLPLLLTRTELRVGRQGIPLRPGGRTPWVRLRFGSAHGLAQFVRLDEASLYMTPIQIDPARPATPISWPPLFSVALSEVCGPFATCGLAEDTGAREDGVLGDGHFLAQAQGIHEEREKQFFHLLERTPEGCLLAVFDGPDRVQHMFSGPDQEQVLDSLYQRMDELVGRAQARLRPGEVMMVLSDHGFKPLHTLVDVNAWLHQTGILRRRDGQVDWAASQAAVYNLSGIRLNRAGRESQGVVEQAEVGALLDHLRTGLLALEYQGEKVFQGVFPATAAYRGPYVERAPDLVLGFTPGFGIFKDASRGLVSEEVFHPNRSAWCGDHCFHPDSVPGVLFCNQPLRETAHITDLAATILDLHGLPTPAWMDGRSLLSALPDAVP